jgi:hypothetical protein
MGADAVGMLGPAAQAQEEPMIRKIPGSAKRIPVSSANSSWN